MSTSTVRRSAIVFSASCYVALRLTEQAVRPTVERVWRGVSSDEALDLYAYCIVAVHDIAILLGKVAIAAGRDCRRWADAFVDSHLEPAIADQPCQPDQPLAKNETVAEMEPWDEPMETAPPAATVAVAQPKRGRGRPKGSKNRKSKTLTTA